MIVYIITTLLATGIAFTSDILYKSTQNISVKKIGIIISAIPPILVASIRYNVGTDYITYSNFQFPTVLSGQDKNFDIVEPLYQVIIYIGHFFDNNFMFYGYPYQWIFILTHILIVGFVFYGIYLQIEYISLPILLFFISNFYFTSLNAMRQGIGIAIFFFALQYIFSKDWKRYFFWCAIATGFHISSIMFFPIYFITLFSKKVYAWTLCIPIFLLFIANKLAPILLKLAIIFSTKYVKYFIVDYNIGLSRSSFVVLLIILLIFYFCFHNGSERQKTLYMIQLLLTIITSLGDVYPQSSRLVYSLLITVCLSIPELYKMSKYSKTTRFLITSFLIILLIIYCEIQFSAGRNELLPFRTIWRNEIK